MPNSGEEYAGKEIRVSKPMTKTRSGLGLLAFPPYPGDDLPYWDKMVLAKYQVDPSCGWLLEASHFTFRVLALSSTLGDNVPWTPSAWLTAFLPPDQLSHWPKVGTCGFWTCSVSLLPFINTVWTLKLVNKLPWARVVYMGLGDIMKEALVWQCFCLW